MFAKDKVTKSMIDAVNSVLMEKKMDEAELDETGLRKAAYAAHKAGQSHFEFQGKKYPVKVRGESVEAGEAIEEASVKVPTKTGMIVYGGAKGGSAKAYRDQHGDPFAGAKGPSDKELKAVEKEKTKKEWKEEVEEDFNIEDFSLEEIQDFMQTEDYEQLDELSKKTLASYTKKVLPDVLRGQYNRGRKDVQASSRPGGFNPFDSKRHSRMKGLEKAVGRMAKEEVEELDELSKDTLKRYIPTAAADLSKKGINSGIDAQSGKTGVTKAYGDHFQKRYRGIIKATNKLAKEDTYFSSRLVKGLYENKGNQPQETFTDNNMGEEKMSDAQMKKREKIVMSMKDKTADFKSKYGKNWKNVMYATATKQAMKEESEEVTEDLEQLDELSPKTLGSYVKKAKGSAIGAANAMGMTSQSSKAHQSAEKKLVKRGAGINKAVDRLTKEDVELTEAEVTTPAANPNEVTTDMLRGRVQGGKANSFKSFKLQLKTDGEMKAPPVEKGDDTREKQKITTSPVAVDIKFDDKLGHPTVQSHFADEKHITSEDVSGLLKSLHNKANSEYNKEIAKFNSKVVQAKKIKEEDATYTIEDNTLYQINEEKPEHTHVAHYEDKAGNWMAKLLINAEHDGHAIDHATKAIGKGPFAGLKIRKIERVHKVMEETDLEEAKEDPPFEGPYTKAKDTVTDKSGAKHTPMSRVKDLARQALKKVKTETMMGKISN